MGGHKEGVNATDQVRPEVPPADEVVKSSPRSH